MIHRRLEGGTIRNGINWNYKRQWQGWWFQLILETPWFRTQFRYRSWLPGKHIKEFVRKPL